MTDPTFTPFGAQLEPALLQACGGRLRDLHWFRTDWQRGGALTGYAVWAEDGEEDEQVVVKLPVPPQELRWLQRLQPDQHEAGDVVPRLFADGTTIGGYDLAWVVMERLTHGPLGGAWEGQQWPIMAEALARFYKATSVTPVDNSAPPHKEDWPNIIKRARTQVREQSIPQSKPWNNALKSLGKKLSKMIEPWDQRDIVQWRHGDAHLANAMTRKPPPEGPALLFDLAEVRAGNWIEDAVYLEHLFWAKRDQLGEFKLVNTIAKHRKKLGLPVDDNWPKLAAIRRTLIAASAPAYMQAEGNPHHLHAALEVLESNLGQV